MFNAIKSLFAAKDKPVSVSSTTVAGLLEGYDTDTLLAQLEHNDYLYQAMRDNGISPHKLQFMLDDDEIGGAWGKRTLAVERRTFSLSDTKSEAGLFVYEQLRQWYKPLSAEFLNAVLFGLSVPELIYKQDDKGRYVIASIIQHDIDRFSVDKAGRVYLQNKQAQTVAIDSDELLKHKFYPVLYRRSKQRPAGNPLLVSLVWPWFLRTKVWTFWAKYLERFGSPQWLGKAATGFDVLTGETNAQKMAKMLSMAVSSGVVVVGNDEEATAIDASGSGGDSFDKADDKLNARIQKRILGQTLTTEIGSSGSYAAASVHKDVSDEIAADDIALITPAMQAVVNSLIALNYPTSEPIEFAIDHNANLNEERAKRDIDLFNQGVRFKPEYYSNHYDLDLAEFEVTSAPVNAGLFSAKPPIQYLKFSAVQDSVDDGQQQIDSLIDDALQVCGSAVDAEAIKEIISKSKNPDDLAERLAKFYDTGEHSGKFSDTLAACLFAADIVGYEQADKGLGE